MRCFLSMYITTCCLQPVAFWVVEAACTSRSLCCQGVFSCTAGMSTMLLPVVGCLCCCRRCRSVMRTSCCSCRGHTWTKQRQSPTQCSSTWQQRTSSWGITQRRHTTQHR